VTIEKCLMDFCIELAPIDASAPKFFGFSEFLTSLALMVLAWTTTDVRYRFRIDCAPIPLKGITFWVVVIVGMLTLLTDLWRAKQWPVPTSFPLEQWQAIMGGMLLLTFFTWAWFAFIKPPKYGMLNAKRFTRALYIQILNGSTENLSVIADEIQISAHNIIKHANKENKSRVSRQANCILELISDKRLCRSIINNSPTTALSIFQEISNTNRYDIPIEKFIQNIIIESINNKNSFLYRNLTPIDPKVTKHDKPIDETLFSNNRIIEKIGDSLSPYVLDIDNWDNDQWNAYCKITLIALKNYNPEEQKQQPIALMNSIENIRRATAGLYKLNSNLGTATEDNEYDRLKIAIKFIEDSINVLNEKIISTKIKPHIGKRLLDKSLNIYDTISLLMHAVIRNMSEVTTPHWSNILEHKIMSHPFFFKTPDKNTPEDVIQGCLRRLIYVDIMLIKALSLDQFAGLARFLFSLTTTNKVIQNENEEKSVLFDLILRWFKNNYDYIYIKNPRIARLCLKENITYNRDTYTITRNNSNAFRIGKPGFRLNIYPANSSPAPSFPPSAEH